ncbi:MAG: hypothetical protein N2450_02075 [bacterium]|nr:hypothetical protein [bacterium]
MSIETILGISRGTARFGTVAFVLLILASIVMEGLPKPTTSEPYREYLTFITLLLTVVGMVIAWMKEIVGGIITVGCILVAFIVDFNAFQDEIWKVGIYATMLLIGICYLIAGWLSVVVKKREEEQEIEDNQNQ